MNQKLKSIKDLEKDLFEGTYGKTIPESFLCLIAAGKFIPKPRRTADVVDLSTRFNGKWFAWGFTTINGPRFQGISDGIIERKKIKEASQMPGALDFFALAYSEDDFQGIRFGELLG